MSSRQKSTNAKVARERFGALLSKLRVFRGHPSAYGFFHGLGGKKAFGFSYNHYLMVESGQRLPGVDALEKIALALFGARDKSFMPERRQLLQSYLRALGDGGRIFDLVWEEAAPAESASPDDEVVNEAAKRRISEVPRLSVEQAETIFTSATTFWCHQWLLQTGRKKKPSEIAKALGFEEAPTQQALEALLSKKVVEKTRAGEYRSRYHETDAFVPSPKLVKTAPWISREIDVLRANAPEGKHAGGHGYFFLALESTKDFEVLYELFRKTMRKSYLYRKKGPVKGAGFLCSAEWRFFRLFDFPED